MEYISSPPYDRLIATGEMFHVKMEKRLELLRTVASTISAAHKRGIIHRDIKPGNINGVETPYLLDFSIALETRYAVHSRPDVGTGIYMPPPDGPPDALSDNYSFALVAYEVLFGQHAIFTPQDTTGTVMEIRALAGERLEKREWRLPSRIPLEELPGDLRGADLFLLDSIFEKALGPRKERHTDLTRFVDDLIGAILIEANQHYLETHDPLPPAFRERIPTEAEWTQNEVSVEMKLTNPDAHAPYPIRRIPVWMISGAVIVTLLIVFGILILSRTG
jgi:serine/threonine protein kinase